MTEQLHHPSPSRSLRRATCSAFGLLALSAFWPSAALAQDDAQGEVTTPSNADPNETYNLPPNFNPTYRPKKTPRNTKVTIDFRKAQLEEVVKFFSSIMDKNFIIDDTLQAGKTITIISPEPVSINEAYKAFLAALQMNGLTIVPMGSFLKIVPSKTALKEPLDPIGAGERIPDEARMVTAILPIDNADPAEIQKIVQQFASSDATIVSYGSSLIVTENGSNLRRLRRIISRLDQSESANKVYVYKVQHADATEIQTKLNEIFNIAPAGGNAARARAAKPAQSTGNEEAPLDVDVSEIIADERTNQLIILSDERSFNRIQQMIELLDVPTAVGGQIHVKFLEYSNAEELAGTLSGLASGASRNNSGRRQNRAAAPSTPPAPGSGDAQLLQGDVQITSHQPTNSLIVVSSPRDFLALERVVDLLDRPRRQVYVEAVIMELNFKDDLSLGLSSNVLAPQELGGIIPDSAVESGAIEDTTGGWAFKTPQSPDTSGGLLALLGPAISIPGAGSLGLLTPSAFAVYLQATQREDSINILSMPSLMTLDNEEAEIVVGDKVPFPRFAAGGGLGGLGGLGGALGGAAGQAAGALGGLGGLVGGLGFPQQVQYEDVGITLRIRPQINESQYVRLEVDQEVSSIGAPSDLGPTRSNRSIKTIVLVKDQSTIVIGGLMRDDENETETKVPFFGDIPLIGVLFRTKNSVKTKQNLVLMLTPYIIEGESDLRKIDERKRREREELLKLFEERDIDYMRTVNYEKKGGLVDRMRATIAAALEDEAARRAALEAFEDTGPRYQILGPNLNPSGDDADSNADGVISPQEYIESQRPQGEAPTTPPALPGTTPTAPETTAPAPAPTPQAPFPTTDDEEQP